MARPQKGTQTHRIHAKGIMPQVSPRARRRWTTYNPGLTPEDAIVIGDVYDWMVPWFVECDAMSHGMRHGDQRWVIGSAVEAAVTAGHLIAIEAPEIVPPPDRTPEQPRSEPVVTERVEVFYCSDCTATWSANKESACTCDPVDESAWKVLAR